MGNGGAAFDFDANPQQVLVLVLAGLMTAFYAFLKWKAIALSIPAPGPYRYFYNNVFVTNQGLSLLISPFIQGNDGHFLMNISFFLVFGYWVSFHLSLLGFSWFIVLTAYVPTAVQDWINLHGPGTFPVVGISGTIAGLTAYLGIHHFLHHSKDIETLDGPIFDDVLQIVSSETFWATIGVVGTIYLLISPFLPWGSSRTAYSSHTVGLVLGVVWGWSNLLHQE